MERYEHHEIIIIGGGICGLATALAFHRKGIKCTVLERFESVRGTGAAMIMLPNGWRALDHLGVAGQLRKTAILIKGGDRISVSDGKRIRLPLGQVVGHLDIWDGEIRSLKRQDLVRALAENLPEGTVQYSCRVVSLKIDEKSGSVIHLDDGRVLIARLVIGCDGVHSVVSDALGLSPMKVTDYIAIRGFTYYPNGHNLAPEFLIYTSEQGRFGYIPITHKSVYWFITRIKKTQDSHTVGDKPKVLELALDFIKGYDQKLIEMVKKTDMDMLLLTTSLTLRSPFDLLTNTFRKGTVTVAGDALHAMGPFLAQGGSLSLEDAVILAHTISPSISTGPTGPLLGKDIEIALDRYFQLRKMRAFWMMSHTFLQGVIAGTIPSKLIKFMCILVLIILFGQDPSGHTRFDCGPL